MASLQFPRYAPNAAERLLRAPYWEATMKLMLSAFALLFLGVFGNARADETLKFRATMHGTFVQSQEVGDVDGHALGVARFSGLASFPDGTVGTSYFVAATDYIKGAGTFSVYQNLTLNNGSVLWFKYAGTATVEGTTTLFKGTVTVLGGKGRFEDAKGDGTGTGARLTPLAVGADLYNDLVINVKK
jgi:hypothetical protein